MKVSVQVGLFLFTAETAKRAEESPKIHLYAAFCKYCVEQYKDHARTIVELTNNSIFSGIRNGYIAVLKAAAARAMDKDPQAFAEAEKRLEKRVATEHRERSGKQPIPPERSLGVISGYDE